MIHITFEEPSTQEWSKWLDTCKEAQNEHNRRVAAGERPEFKKNVYAGQKKAVYLNPDDYFFGKCAYCEQIIHSNQYGDIEHYRPKASVTDFDNKPVRTRDGEEDEVHPGYYWLAYDWKNLLPSCMTCNRKGKDIETGGPIGKGNYFPVAEFRAERPGEEVDEDPLLLHPIWDDPVDHLEIDHLGVLSSKSDKGRETIRILGLNLRGLPEARRDEYDRIHNLVGVFIREVHDKREVTDFASSKLEEISDAFEGRKQYTVAARKAVDDDKNLHMDLWSELNQVDS